MKYAFITGAAGFIGGYITREFVGQGWHVFALVHKNTSQSLEELAEYGSVTIVRGDINNFNALEVILRELMESREAVIDAVVHCAGRASDVGRRDEFRKVNFESVQNICDLINRLNIRRFVFISTTDVYGLRDFNGESENELPKQNNTANPYPEFKIAAENWIQKTLSPERYSIIRPAAVWGVGDPTLTPRIVSFLKSSPWIVHFGKWKGKNRWPLAHVRNVASAAFIAATMPSSAGLAINVLDSEVTTMDEFYRIIASIYLPEKKLRSITLPFWIGKVFGAIVSRISNMLNLEHPFTDPSLYALYSVASNLDFSNRTLIQLFESAGKHLVTRDEGVDELRVVLKT